MLKKVNRLFKKKHEGNFGDIIGSMLCFLFMFVVLTTCINSSKIMSLKTNVDRMARSSMLRLETKGELSDKEVQELYEKVLSLGFESVDIKVNEGSASKVLYGEPVTIQINGKTSGRYLNLYSSLKNKWDKDYNFGVKYESISKASK
jgi:hypothetical protein